jgi:hypothetical protein
MIVPPSKVDEEGSFLEATTFMASRSVRSGPVEHCVRVFDQAAGVASPQILPSNKGVQKRTGLLTRARPFFCRVLLPKPERKAAQGVGETTLEQEF